MKNKLTYFLLAPIVWIAGCFENNDSLALKLANEATALARQGKYQEAITLTEEASKLQPSEASYQTGLAIFYSEQGDFKRAQEYYEAALKLLKKQAEKDQEKVDDLILVLVCLNREEEARKEIEFARERYGKDTFSLEYEKSMIENPGELNDYKLPK